MFWNWFRRGCKCHCREELAALKGRVDEQSKIIEEQSERLDNAKNLLTSFQQTQKLSNEQASKILEVLS